MYLLHVFNKIHIFFLYSTFVFVPSLSESRVSPLLTFDQTFISAHTSHLFGLFAM